MITLISQPNVQRRRLRKQEDEAQKLVDPEVVEVESVVREKKHVRQKLLRRWVGEKNPHKILYYSYKSVTIVY